MVEFRFEGYTYDLWIKPWKKGNRKYEALRWKTGWKCTWKRIPYELFIKMKKKWNASRALANALRSRLCVVRDFKALHCPFTD
ncbi:hypothetical protein SD074_04000 [Prolixibacter sp. SD074]|nr:hypothetical protein SD074_04000 [Prolixibacter sp. SD074]